VRASPYSQPLVIYWPASQPGTATTESKTGSRKTKKRRKIILSFFPSQLATHKGLPKKK
jgi:hypothetical protein